MFTGAAPGFRWRFIRATNRRKSSATHSHGSTIGRSMLQALIAGVVLIILGLVTGQSPLWLIGIAVIAGGLIRWFFISGRHSKL
jgi:hypothetical protein